MRGALRQKSVRSMVPKKAEEETIELNRMLTVGREATCWEQEARSLSPPAVPRTR